MKDDHMSNSGQNPPGTNDTRLVTPPDYLVGAVVNKYDNLPQVVGTQTQKLSGVEQSITLDDATRLMANVQAAQRNLTDALNEMSKYRRSVARILEDRRRKAANERKLRAGSQRPLTDNLGFVAEAPRAPQGTAPDAGSPAPAAAPKRRARSDSSATPQ